MNQKVAQSTLPARWEAGINSSTITKIIAPGGKRKSVRQGWRGVNDRRRANHGGDRLYGGRKLPIPEAFPTRRAIATQGHRDSNSFGKVLNGDSHRQHQGVIERGRRQAEFDAAKRNAHSQALGNVVERNRQY